MSPRRQTYLLSLWHAKKQHETSLLWLRLWSIGHGQGHGQHVANSAQCTFLTVTIYMQICCTSKRRELVEQKPVVASAKYSLNYSRHCSESDRVHINCCWLREAYISWSPQLFRRLLVWDEDQIHFVHCVEHSRRGFGSSANDIRWFQNNKVCIKLKCSVISCNDWTQW